MPPIDPDTSDEQLAVRAQRGCAEAWSCLSARYEDRLLHFLWHRTRQPADAEDIRQETLLRAWRKLDQYDPQRSFATWLFIIAGRLAIDHHRRARLRQMDALVEHPDANSQPETRLIAEETRENIWALAARVLSTTQYEAMWLRYGEQMSTGEIARIMQRRNVTVRVMLLRAGRRLRAALESESHPTAPRSVKSGARWNADAPHAERNANQSTRPDSIGGTP